MGLRVWSCIRTAAGEIVPIPRARLDRLWRRDEREALPEHAGSWVCLATAYLQTEDGEPTSVARIDYVRMKLDEAGRLDGAALDRMRRLCGSPLDWLPRTEPARVIRAGHQFERRQYRAEFSWVPTTEQEREIIRKAMRPRRRPPEPLGPRRIK